MVFLANINDSHGKCSLNPNNFLPISTHCSKDKKTLGEKKWVHDCLQKPSASQASDGTDILP